MTRKSTSIALVALLALAASGPALASLCEFGEVVLFATNSIDIKDTSKVLSGAVVVNDASGGPTLAGGVELNLRKKAQVGDISADSIAIAGEVVVAGQALCNELSDSTGSVTCDPLPLPVFDSPPAFLEADVRPDAEDVTVGAGESVELGAGDYGDITVSGFGTIVFTGGTYHVRSIDTADEASLLFQAPSEVRIEGRFDCGKKSTIGPDVGSNIGAADTVFYVGGINGLTGGIDEKPRAAEFGDETTVEANFYVPNGRLHLKKKTVAIGAFLARDIHVDKEVQLSLASAFTNRAPAAFAQDVLTDGANDLVITLEGSDPEGADLTFTIEVDPAEGTLSAPSPITPATVQQCSQSGESCSLDSDCPGFNEGETCQTKQPPITQATVTYTPDLNNNCVTDPESGEVTCPEDFFTFGVTDDCGDLGTAIVSVNGGTDEEAGDPGTGVDVVEANDLEIDVVVNAVQVITLSAAAPDTVASLTFRVETLPTGALQDSNGAAVVVGVDLPSPVVTYQAPGTAGSDSFTFSARDSSTTAPPCGPPSCGTGTVNIDIGNLPELAPDQSVGTDLNTPVEVTLLANSGGTGGGAALTAAAAVVTEITYGDNGALSASQIRQAATRAAVPVTRATLLGVDQGWSQFSWCDIATSPGCDDLVDLVNESPVIEGPFDFTTTGDSCLRVTDTLAKGDHWRVENLFGSNVDWTDFTSEVDQSTVGTTSDPNVAFGDLSYSHGEFDIDAGTFSIRLITIPPDSFAFGTAGYIRVDTGPCVDIVWTVTSLPAAGTGILTNLDGSPVNVGATYQSTPTVVFTPAFNFSGPTSFNYEVAQGGTLGTALVVDTAIVDLLVSTSDLCIINGRDAGCAPGGGGSFQAPLAQDGADDSETGKIDGPSDGFTVVVEGIGGTVSTSPVELSNGRFLLGHSCTGECTKRFPAGELVKLFARPDGDDFEFVRWGGACRGTDPITTVRLRRETLCTATFAKKAAE